MKEVAKNRASSAMATRQAIIDNHNYNRVAMSALSL